MAGSLAARAERELRSLVGVSSPSGDVAGAEEALAVAEALAPEQATSERVPCSSPEHAPDLILRLEGTGRGRLLLVGHVDTVIPHRAHRPVTEEGDRLTGSGTVDMKGGVVLSLGVARALSAHPERFAECSLLLVTDEEWRVDPFVHIDRFAHYDACLCFEAGQLNRDGQEAVVVRRKAAGTLRVIASGRAAHSGSAPDAGRNALLALAQAAIVVAERHAPAGPEHLSVVPTVMRSGDAFNVVPAAGELIFDMRADSADAFAAVQAAVPGEVGGATLAPRMERVWPAMNRVGDTEQLLADAGERLGRPIIAASRGGASDASHFATVIPLTVDGLGPRGGGAHTPEEFVLAPSLRQRAEVALAVAGAALE